jgi:hypothetical protein
MSQCASVSVPVSVRIHNAGDEGFFEARRKYYKRNGLLTIGGNPKIDKSDEAGLGYFTAILHLSPSRLSGVNLCPSASKGCIEACLNTAGRGRMTFTQTKRLKRSGFLNEDRQAFTDQIRRDIKAFVKRCERLGLKPAIRLNGTSDIIWETTGIMSEFPTVQFYDYTAIQARMLPRWGKLPDNYDLTFSRKEDNHDKAMEVLAAGRNVAVVFRDKLPETWNGYKVIDGTKHDLRFLDEKGVVVGLLAKGDAKHDMSGFVVDAA